MQIHRKKSRRKEKNLNLVNSFLKFSKIESFGGILLIFVTILAIFFANSSLRDIYYHFIHVKITIGFGNFKLENSLAHWVNDALMSLFFLLVGLEIKREFLIGELSTPEKAILPAISAIGGMLFPALIFYLFTHSYPEYVKGWAIPMATDIAFALGILSITGKKFPLSLKVFLTAFATIDDIGGVIVIALFYTEKIVIISLLIMIIIFLIMILLNKEKVENPVIYMILGILLWFFTLKSGIHATVAGILTAFAIPARGSINLRKFFKEINFLLEKIKRKKLEGADPLIIGKKTYYEIETIEEVCHKFQPPLLRIEHHLHPWITFFILPMFAFVNAGIEIPHNITELISSKVSIGVILGLFIGKQLGIFTFTYLAVKSKLCTLPKGINWRMIYGISILGGIGFTMSMFINSLAFKNYLFINQAKVGILISTLISSIFGIIVLRASLYGRKKETTPKVGNFSKI